MALWTLVLFEAAVSTDLLPLRRPVIPLNPSLSSLVVTLGLIGAQKRAREGPIFRSWSGLERLKYGTVDAEMTRSGCICVPDTHTEALDDSGTVLVFGGGDYGLERGSEKGAGEPHSVPHL